MNRLAYIGLLFLLLHGTQPLVADIRQVHILHTADIHAHLKPDKDGHGGWFKAATLIKRLRQQLGSQNTLLIDCGDTVQGTLSASLSHGMVAIPPLTLLQYDAWIPGNHELDFGIPQFLSFMEETRAIHLCGNLSIKGHAPFTAWKMFTRNGVRIALIGINSSYLRNWALPQEEHLLQMTPARKLLPRLLADILPQRPHLIILAAHQGWFRGPDTRQANEINDIAWSFPEIDLILGAHTHRLIPGTKIGRRTWYVQPGAHASHVALITVTIDTDKTAPLSITSRTLPVDSSLPEDQDMTALAAPFLQQEDQERARPLKGFLSKAATAHGTPGKSCATSELMAMALAWKTSSPIVFHGRHTRSALPAGKLTGAHLYALCPYDNTIVTAMLTPRQIQDILTEQLKWRSHYSFSGLYGIHTQRDAKGKLILDPDELKRLLPPEGRIRVAFNSHTAAGSGRFCVLRSILALPDSRTTRHPITTIKALEDFLAQNPGRVIRPRRWLAK